MDDVATARVNLQHRIRSLAWVQRFGTLAHIEQCTQNVLAARWALAHAQARETGDDA